MCVMDIFASHDYQPLVVFLTGIQFAQVSKAIQQDSEGHQRKLLMKLIQLAHGVLQVLIEWPRMAKQRVWVPEAVMALRR